MSIEAMKQALEALIAVEALIEHQYTGTRDGMTAFQDAADDAHFAIEPLRQAIEQAQKQEPVAWRYRMSVEDGHWVWNYATYIDAPKDPRCEPLYTSPPPSQPWAGLTDEDKQIAFDDTQEGGGFWEFADAIEATLRKKNHG